MSLQSWQGYEEYKSVESSRLGHPPRLAKALHGRRKRNEPEVSVTLRELLREEDPALVEHRQTYDGLCDAYALAAEDSAQAKLPGVVNDLPYSTTQTDTLLVDVGRLHYYLKS